MTAPPQEERRTFLVVDDDEVFRTRLVAALAARGFDTQGAADYDQALALAQSDSPEFAVVDLRMPGRSGLDLIRELKSLDPTTVILVLTGYGSIATAVESLRLGALNYLTKPVDVDQVIAAIIRTEDPRDPAKELETPTLARVEWEHIHRVLNDCSGNISQAARLLGLHRRSLQRKLAKFPVRR